MKHPSIPPTRIEPLEERRLFSSVFSFGFSSDLGFPADNTIGLPGAGSFLPTLPGSSTDRPIPPGILFALTASSSGDDSSAADVIDVRGAYTGAATVTGVGSTDFDLSITRQRRGTITGTLAIPQVTRHFTGTVPVTFLGNRRFTATFTRGAASATLVGRLNRDGTITGEFMAVTSAGRFDGTIALARNATS